MRERTFARGLLELVERGANSNRPAPGRIRWRTAWSTAHAGAVAGRSVSTRQRCSKPGSWRNRDSGAPRRKGRRTRADDRQAGRRMSFFHYSVGVRCNLDQVVALRLRALAPGIGAPSRSHRADLLAVWLGANTRFHEMARHLFSSMVRKRAASLYGHAGAIRR